MIASVPDNSSKAPPIAVNPLPISDQDNAPKPSRASESITQALAIARIDKLVRKLTEPLRLIIANAPDRIKREPATPSNPLASPVQDSSLILVIALARMLIACAIAIIAIPALIVPFALNLIKVLDIVLKPLLSTPIMAAIAATEYPILAGSMLEIVLSEDESIIIAPAMPTNDITFNPVVKADSEPCTPSRTLENLATIDLASSFPKSIPFNPPPNKSLACLNNPAKFLRSTNMPPPASPANISDESMFSLNHPMTLLATSIIPLNTSEILVPILDSPSPKLPTPPVIAEIASDTTPRTPLIASLIAEKPLPASNPLFRLVNKSPIDPVIARKVSRSDPTDPPKRKSPNGSSTAVTAFLPMSKIENKPLNVLLRLLAEVSLSLKFSVRL